MIVTSSGAVLVPAVRRHLGLSLLLAFLVAIHAPSAQASGHPLDDHHAGHLTDGSTVVMSAAGEPKVPSPGHPLPTRASCHSHQDCLSLPLSGPAPAADAGTSRGPQQLPALTADGTPTLTGAVPRPPSLIALGVARV